MKQINKKLPIKTINPYYFSDRALQVGFKTALENHYSNNANYKLNIKSNYPDYGVDVRDNNKIVKELSVVYAQLTNLFFFKNQTVF